jgi:negative regulator of genetic competence, sporulation and motility
MGNKISPGLLRAAKHFHLVVLPETTKQELIERVTRARIREDAEKESKVRRLKEKYGKIILIGN